MDRSIQYIIADFLTHTDFVCIPNLGTFLVQKEVSGLDYALGIATPPYKKIVFNTDIKTDDHALRNLIVKKMALSEQQAQQRIETLVQDVTQKLYKDGLYRLEELGTLVLSNNHIRFEQDRQTNIDSNSYGLSKVNFSKYITPNQNLKLRPAMSKNEAALAEQGKAKNKSNKTIIWVSVISPVVLTIAALGFLWENRQDQTYASLNPFFSGVSTVAVKKTNDKEHFNYDDPMGRNTDADKVEQAEQVNIESAPESNTKVLSEAQEITEDFPTVDQEGLAKSTVVIKAGEIVSGKSGRYYIICASYQTLKKAEAVAKDLEEAGYESVKILEPHDNVNRYRIALMDFENPKEASVKAKELRPKHGEDIWVYKY